MPRVRRTTKPTKTGKPRKPYTHSKASLAQRRGAARKTGAQAVTANRQYLPSCTQKQCPLGAEEFPCSVKTAVEAQGAVIESCPIPLFVDSAIRDKYVTALATGNPESLNDIVATSLAGLSELGQRELQALMKEGLAIEEPILGVDGPMKVDGEILVQMKVNPRAAPTLKVMEMLGHTAEQQALTRKSAGEKNRDESVGGFLAEITKMHAALGVPSR